MLPWAKFSVHSIAKEWRTGPSPHHFFSSPVHSKILLWYVFASDGEVPKIPLNSNSSDFHYTKTMKHWKCRVILSMKVNINCMKLNNSYQSSLSSLSASLNKMFFVRKKALAEWLWLKLLTSTCILMNNYPEFSRDSSFLLSDIILPETTNVLWVYTVEGGQLWCEIANAANAGLVFPLSCQKQRFIIYRLQKRLF